MDQSQNIFERTYASTLSSEAKMFSDINSCLSETGVSGRRAETIRLCISEAFCNALEHGNKFDSNKTVYVRIELNDKHLIADILDEGAGGIKGIRARKPSTIEDEGGRGMDLIQRNCDEVVLSEGPNGGLRVRLVFSLAPIETKIPEQ